jgi:hypothetical protein
VNPGRGEWVNRLFWNLAGVSVFGFDIITVNVYLRENYCVTN